MRALLKIVKTSSECKYTLTDEPRWNKLHDESCAGVAACQKCQNESQEAELIGYIYKWV